MCKRFMAILLAAVLVLSLFTGCSGSSKVPDDLKVYGDTESRDPLRICVDLDTSASSDPTYASSSMNDFVYALKSTLGYDDVRIEYIQSPYSFEGGLDRNNVAVRSTAVDRLRVEILSGGGPDLFLMAYMAYGGPQGVETETIDILFKYPQKAMENGLFLPLDDYMENHTEYAEWDKFPEGVMAAGRNAEGQQIIPMSYSIPLLVLPKTEFDHTPTRQYTWNDLLTAPELSPYGLDMANCSSTVIYYDSGEESEPYYSGAYLVYSLGELVDFEKEELLFTEEELLQRVQEILALEQTDTYKEVEGAEEMEAGIFLGQERFPNPVTMIPLYSDDGGVTARISTYAAINRNTDKPEEAYRVLDYLMSRGMQKSSTVHTRLIRGTGDLPMHEELMRDEDVWMTSMQYYMIPENYEELCEVRDQITGATFSDELVVLLSQLLSKCDAAEIFDMTVEEIVHEVYDDIQRRVRE